MIQIKLIDNQQDLQQVFRLRYAVYVKELGAEMEHADHQRKEVREPWDETGDNLGAWINGELVGCLRINFGGQSDLSEYQDFFDPILADEYAGCPLEHISVSSKFAVHQRHRGATLAVRLAQASYVQFQEKHSRANYLTCRPNLVPMYRKLGFELCASAFHHHEAGWITPMVLVVQDYETLRQIKSPFADICARYPINQEQATKLRARLGTHRFQRADDVREPHKKKNCSALFGSESRLSLGRSFTACEGTRNLFVA